ncbi:unnamed protein product, partial [marine sediment metagenome]
MVSFLQNGTFMEHAPTMGKELSQIEVQGIRINVIDMGGQKDFRNLWTGEASTAECVIFMIDAFARERFSEARDELWKLSSIFKKKPLIILANKYDLQPVASIGEIIEALNLKDLPSFEVLPISCKTGYGIVKAFMKIYYKLTGNQLTQKTNHAKAWNHIGFSYEKLNQFDKAIDSYKIAVGFESTYASAHYNLANAYKH